MKKKLLALLTAGLSIMMLAGCGERRAGSTVMKMRNISP